MSKLSNLQSWIDIHIGSECRVDPPTRDCLISLAQMVQKELEAIKPTKQKEKAMRTFTEIAIDEQHKFEMTRSFHEELRELILGLDLGYKYQMSDYASSRESELEYEKEGLAEVEEVITQILSLIEREVIKEDAPEVENIAGQKALYWRIIDRNKLRAEQRKILRG